ncbi:MAG: type II toxin-antitoxin system RelB/DinJ family antitoxin [Lachnospiraceae bacterium]|nr:type II toxin-antitoxin system RelB/DinJ family antitoxin [Lachnospiraceae bacterium]
MAKEATLQVRMDADLKEQAEELYKKLGTSFAEAVRIFARQSVQENAMPFMVRLTKQEEGKRIGVAEGEFIVPEDIDKYNDEVMEMFGGIG